MASEVVDTVLRHGVNETTIDVLGCTAIEVIGTGHRGSQFLLEEADQVRVLLTNAQADRAWRRMGHPGDVPCFGQRQGTLESDG